MSLLSPPHLVADLYPMTPPLEGLTMNGLHDSQQAQFASLDFYLECGDPTGGSFAPVSITAPQPQSNLFNAQPLLNYEDFLLPMMNEMGDMSRPAVSLTPSISPVPILSSTPELCIPVEQTHQPQKSSAPMRRKSSPKDQQDSDRHHCTDCPASFVSKYHLRRHMKKHAPDASKKFKCTVPGCRITSHRSDNIAKHIETHNKRLLKQTQQRERFLKGTMHQSQQGPTIITEPMPSGDASTIELVGMGKQNAAFAMPPADGIFSDFMSPYAVPGGVY
ncbi:MAG: hypothetical protein SGCHY_004195 [Lobulomycetales sp.]